jgi:hypothetical protein
MSTTNAKEILEKLRSKKATNINNINYNNYINDINDSTTSMICEASHNQVEEISLRSPLGLVAEPLFASQGTLATPRDSIHFSGGSELPPTWRGAKWDIYKNPSRGKLNLKVKLSVIKSDRTTQSLTASMNSPHDRLWRGVENQNTQHWLMMRDLYKDYRQQLGPTIEHWRVSKFYLNSKKASIDIMSLFLHWTDGDYCLRLVLDGIIYDFVVAKNSYENLTDKQRSNNQVATAFFGRSQVKMVHPKELGLL